MRVAVLKFGGKLLSSIDKILDAARLVIDFKNSSYHPVVVVSAMGNETDTLIELATNIDGILYKRELDRLVSIGELKSAALFTMALLKLGAKASSLDYRTLGIKTDSQHFDARVVEVDASYIYTLIAQGIIPVIPGFQGVDTKGDVTTLGRGGSDTSAVAIAGALMKFYPFVRCILFKDVGGVYNKDPKLYKDAKIIKEISINELFNILGGSPKVIHGESLNIAQRFGVTIEIASLDGVINSRILPKTLENKKEIDDDKRDSRNIRLNR